MVEMSEEEKEEFLKRETKNASKIAEILERNGISSSDLLSATPYLIVSATRDWDKERLKELLSKLAGATLEIRELLDKQIIRLVEKNSDNPNYII